MLDEEWNSNFRMSRNDFMGLEEKLEPYAKPKQNLFHWDTIPSGMSSNTFGPAICTLFMIFGKLKTEVFQALRQVLMPELIVFSTIKEGLGNLTAHFKENFGFPKVLVCIDGTHSPVC